MLIKKKSERNKIDTAKALELHLKKGMSYADIGIYYNVSTQAVHQALKRFKALITDKTEIDALRINKAEILDSVELTLLNDLVDTDKRKAASLNNVAYALQNVNNMNRLEKGQPTANIQYVDLSASLETIRREREQLQEQLDSMDI
jgi:predicted DNA-binding protein YlxM (UPF0122 family)